jgi:hypothetical protein
MANGAALIDGRMARLAAELLPQLSPGDAECAARDSKRPAHAGFFPDHSVSLVKVKERWREAIGVVEVLDEGISNALLAAVSPSTAVAAILRDHDILPAFVIGSRRMLLNA